MSTPSKAVVLSVSLVCALLASTFSATPAAAADLSFTLYVSNTQGWGYSPTSLSIPGPTLTVNQGDNVTLRLNATAGTNHRWHVDYDNDAVDDGGSEPNSPAFDAGDPEISWNFTASRNGTYVYRDRGAISMWGLITVRPAGSPSTDLAPGANTLVLVGAAVAIFLAVIAVAVVMGRRRQPPAPPPPE